MDSIGNCGGWAVVLVLINGRRLSPLVGEYERRIPDGPHCYDPVWNTKPHLETCVGRRGAVGNRVGRHAERGYRSSQPPLCIHHVACVGENYRHLVIVNCVVDIMLYEGVVKRLGRSRRLPPSSHGVLV